MPHIRDAEIYASAQRADDANAFVQLITHRARSGFRITAPVT
jgi:hypothetical protein